MFGALLTIASLGVGAAVVLEARAVPPGSATAEPTTPGAVTIAATSVLALDSSEAGSQRGTASLGGEVRRQLQADVVLDVSGGRPLGEISVRRIGETEVAVLRVARQNEGMRGAAVKARELVRTASNGTELVVVTIEAGPDGTAADRRQKGKDPAAFAHRLIDAGADLVVDLGLAPHGGLEWYEGRLIAYGLGGDTAGETAGIDAPQGLSGILRITLTPAGSWVSGRLLPVHTSVAGNAKSDLAPGVFSAIRTQSRADFGPSAVRVGRNGFLRPPAGDKA